MDEAVHRMPIQAYGALEDGAVLVRPDGVIAWRSSQAGDRPTDRLHKVLARLHHLPATTPGRAAHQAGHP